MQTSYEKVIRMKHTIFIIKVCIILRAVQCLRPFELNINAADFLTKNVHKVGNVLKFNLYDNTCYTINEKPCIQQVPSAYHANGTQFNIARLPTEIIDTYTDSVPYDESMVPIPKTAANPVGKILPRYYTAFKLDNTALASVAAGVTLQTIVEDCTRKGEHFEAVVRIMNAIESAGISTMFRFCVLATKLKNADDAIMEDIYVTFTRLLNVIEWKFRNFNISTAPIREIEFAVEVLQNIERSQKDQGYAFFETTCIEFTHRYGNMVDYVSPTQFVNMDETHSANSLIETMYSTIAGASFIF
ncbi:uncharacterized protein LOC126844335 [Adelges cooleyi]|uniref:uncharacterized protein LOC126844335 n=1 Tax=Adelges cooleyi TaxID=133065 RepID=UPI002180550A|nr:uncharacterized protein LOC126844335 [Adelges cooleyi]